MPKSQKYRKMRIAIILILFVLSGCVRSSSSNPFEVQATPVSTNPAEMVASVTAEITALPTSTNTPEPTPTMEVAQEAGLNGYSFVALLDYNKHTLNVQESIAYRNTTGQELNEIQLAVPPNETEGVFTLEEVSLNEGEPVSDYSLEGIVLTIPFTTTLAEDETCKISLKYQLALKINGGILGYTAMQANFSDWYPFVPPYDAELGWLIKQPAEVGEYLMYDMANFELTLALSNGDGLVVAGSTLVMPVEINIYKMIAQNSRGITFSVSDQYQVLSRQYGDFTVNAYVFPGDETAGWATVENTGKALLLFSTLFGQTYPHETLSVVESDFPDGMEYDGLYYLSDFYYKNYNGSNENYLSLLSVHETAHQWWFGLVGNDQANEPWLDEALATYSEYLYYEQYLPGLTDWWWQYRVETYNPSGRSDMTIYDQSDLRTYINSAYLQGAAFLHELRQALGDEAFFANLQTYLATYQYQNARGDDFLGIMIPAASEDTNRILEKYFRE